jgi:hypothetical protein
LWIPADPVHGLDGDKLAQHQIGSDLIPKPNGDGHVRVIGAAHIESMIDLVLQPAGPGGQPVSGADACVTTPHMDPYEGIPEIRRFSSE